MTPMARETTGSGRTSDGRTRLLEAAERLLDEFGIDGTTAAAITQAAGHRNAAAVNYHFGNLDQLIEEVLLRRTHQLNEERHAMLDELEAAGTPDPRDAFRALIAPLAALLEQPDGRRYLRLLNQAANHPRFHHRAEWQFTTSLARAGALVAPLLAHVRPELRAQRARHVIGMALFALADQAWLIDTPQPERTPLPTDEFVEDLVDTGLAALTA
jgi:AcrR family transcriptional regulator